MNITFPSQQKSMTINEGVEAFLFHCQYEKNLNIKTLVAYQTDLAQFTGYLQQAKIPEPLMELNKHMLKQYIQSLYIYKPKTIKRKVASLKAMLNFIEFENDHFINPFRKIRMKYKENYTLPCVMTMQEIKKIMHTVYEKKYTYQQTGGYGFKAVVRDIAVIELLFATGIRVAELCNLSPANIDLKNGKIKVLGKGSKERIIQVCQSEVLIALKEYYRLFTPLIKKQSFFFINRLGAPLSPQSVRLMIREYTKKAGITKRITPHTFRHTFATLLLEEDVDIKYIQNLLGHSSINTTQIYTHVNSVKQKKILSTKHPRRKMSFKPEDKN